MAPFEALFKKLGGQNTYICHYFYQCVTQPYSTMKSNYSHAFHLQLQ